MTEIQQKVLNILKTTGKKQGIDLNYRSETNCFCVRGVVANELFGWDYHHDCFPSDEINDLLPFDEITRWNDVEKLTFEQIAAKLEQRWSK